MFSYENGTTGIKNLNLVDLINKEPVFVPSLKTIEKLNEIISPIYVTISTNGLETEKLAELRDTLLPKLMSGEINV